MMKKEEVNPKEKEPEEKLPLMEELDEQLGKYLEIMKHMHNTSTVDQDFHVYFCQIFKRNMFVMGN